jgi:hypothetical protein
LINQGESDPRDDDLELSFESRGDGASRHGAGAGLQPDRGFHRRGAFQRQRRGTRLAGKRNNIAHGLVDMRFSDPPKLKLGYWLVPSYYATKKHPLKGPSAYAYTSAEITYFLREFDRLWVETGEMITNIARDQRHSS